LISYALGMGRRSCPGCQQLRRRIAELEAIVRDLQARLGQNASNSSLPPSANPPGAPKPVVKEPSGRSPGAQPGHPPVLKQRLPPERLTRVVHYRPERCQHCQTPLPEQAGPGDPEPTWHQVAELPPRRAEVTEHQGHARHCPRCGTLNRAAIPADVQAFSVGPGLTAALSYLRGAHRVSVRGVEEIAETLFEVPIALGTVANLSEEVSRALAVPHAEVLQAVRQAPVKNVDETSWKKGRQLCWLWVAATSRLSVFLVHGRRGLEGLWQFLGTVPTGILCTDRWSAYDFLDPQRRQACWAHLKRDFKKWAESQGPGARVGRTGLEVVRELFACWHRYRDGPGDRQRLQAELAPVRQRLEEALRAGRRSRLRPLQRFCDNLLALGPGLWTFARVEGVEPTNNHAERALRRGVLWRKCSQGSRSEAGCRFVERMLTAVQSLRLQQRSVLDYLTQALTAHRQKTPPPSLLPAG
jgi:transposase